MGRMLTLQQMRVIVAVADAGSFGRAAAALATSQPSVSAAVLSAERELECSLFSRRPVAPTMDCRSILPEMRVVLADAARLEAKAALLGQGPRIFRIAVPTTFRLVYAQQMLDLWGREFSRVSVTLLEGEDDEIKQWLRTDFIDAGILIDPDPDELSEDAVEIFRDVLEGVIQYDHPLAHETRISVDDLLDDRIALSNSGCRSEVESLCRSARPTFRPDLLVRDMNSLLSMVSSGNVVTILPSICEPILPAGVQPIELEPEVNRTLVATLSHGSNQVQRDLFNTLIAALQTIGLPPRPSEEL